MRYPKGSEWRKWDLHFHTPSSYDYKDKSVTDDEIIESLKKEEIVAVAITDHHFIDSDRIKKLKALSGDDITIFPGIEFCGDSRGKEPIHFIGIFPEDSDIDYIWSEIKSKTEIASQRQEGKKDNEIYCDLEDTSILIKNLGGVVSIHAGNKYGTIESITNSLPVNMAEKRDIAEHVDIYELGREEDQEGYIQKVFPQIGDRPMIMCSDNHNAKEYKPKQSCWIKADPTFEGLRQIIYEPKPGERVKIGPVKPDSKGSYKIIRKINFTNSNIFPEMIEFNRNLCSIIGSRSSGKSALLAYIAHSIDTELAEMSVLGPGVGTEYLWEKIKSGNLQYSVEWENGDTDFVDIDSPRKIVYIPQNDLFEKSKDSKEIKGKIEPVLFKTVPDFKVIYTSTMNNINTYNRQIVERIRDWFELSDTIQLLKERLGNLGGNEAIDGEKKKIEAKIKELKEKAQLSEEDTENYQNVSAKISTYESKVEELEVELLQLTDVSETQDFFHTLKINLLPSLESLPNNLQDEINTILDKREKSLLEEVNKRVIEYKHAIGSENSETAKKILKIKSENKQLIEKYLKYIELEGLIKKVIEYEKILKKIAASEAEKDKLQEKRVKCENDIESNIRQRWTLLENLKSSLDSADQSMVEDIEFGIEYGIDEELADITLRLNIKENTKFVDGHEVKFYDIRKQPGEFLSAIYSGEQKINVGNQKEDVARDILSLTEEVLFTAEMEGDKIGGISETTMTPGKRALFFLRLILAESEDTWPLLIDQPEDDLDSRSIYDEVVPYLNEKKKERQIIMVSHNANLVIGADTEQILVANRKGDDRPNEDGKEFNYLTGSIENTREFDKKIKDTLLSQGICEHACDILDGGKVAFERRRNKYNLAES